MVSCAPQLSLAEHTGTEVVVCNSRNLAGETYMML